MSRAVKKKVKEVGPTRQRTAYILFTLLERPKVKAECPQLSFVDIGKELGNRWNALHDDAKKHFKEMEVKDAARYTIEKKAYDEAFSKPVETGEAAET